MPARLQVALTFMKGLSHRAFTEMPVKGGDKIDLGQGHELEFVMAPNLHWPDTMFSFDHATGAVWVGVLVVRTSFSLPHICHFLNR